MNFGKFHVVVCLCSFAVPAFAGVTVSSPGSGSTSASPVHFVASASSACSKGVASVGIYTAPNTLAYKVSGSKLDTLLNMNAGSYSVFVQEWDNCGQSSGTPISLTVSASSGKTFSNLQSGKGWVGYALLPTSFGICTGCTSSGPKLKWSWTPGISSPSMDKISTKTVYGGGTVQWGDVLWNNHLLGDFSSQGLPDFNKTLIPSLHHFTYDVYFWVGNAAVSQGMEFDINQFFGGHGYIWGHRTSSNHLLFHSITLNGKTAILDRTDSPDSRSWYGVTINYQLDGNSAGTPYTVYIDKLNFTVQ